MSGGLNLSTCCPPRRGSVPSSVMSLTHDRLSPAQYGKHELASNGRESSMITVLVTALVVIFVLLAAYMIAFALSFSSVILADVMSRARTSSLNRLTEAVRLYQRLGEAAQRARRHVQRAGVLGR